jgi:hypothetical protein
VSVWRAGTVLPRALTGTGNRPRHTLARPRVRDKQVTERAKGAAMTGRTAAYGRAARSPGP